MCGFRCMGRLSVKKGILEHPLGGLSPLAARFEDIQDGVRGFTRGVVSGVSAGFGFVAVEGAFEDGFEDCPFVVG